MVPSAQDFECMSMEQKEATLTKKGNFIITRTQEEHFIDLYSLNDFFVEVWYVNFNDALDKNFENTRLSLLTDIITIKTEEDINRYIDLYNRVRS
ncbi:MAG: hypothetical protein ACQER7_05325 [Bacteroidota bacterium]